MAMEGKKPSDKLKYAANMSSCFGLITYFSADILRQNFYLVIPLDQ